MKIMASTATRPGDDLSLDLSLTDDPGAMEDAADTFGEAGIEILFSPFDILVSHL